MVFLRKLILDSANDLKKAEYDLGIAIDEYKIAKLKGMSDEELKAYEDQIAIARNSVELSNNKATEQYNSFVYSQARLKGMLDDKMDTLSKQSEVLKKVEEAKESNPDLTRAYNELRRGIIMMNSSMKLKDSTLIALYPHTWFIL